MYEAELAEKEMQPVVLLPEDFSVLEDGSYYWGALDDLNLPHGFGIMEKGDIYYITSNIGYFLSEMGIKKYQLYIIFQNYQFERFCNVEDPIVYSASDKMFYGNIIDLMTYSIFDTLDDEEIMSSYTGEVWLIDHYGYVRSSATGEVRGTMFHRSENNTVFFDKGKPIVDLNLITEATK